jgi:cytoskeletal protein CcmA (bactofilin family)
MVVNGATTLKGGVAIGGGVVSGNARLMDISIPQGENPPYIIYASDLNLPTSNGIFAVTNKGGLECQDWVVTERNVGAQYNGKLHCTYNKDEDGFKFSTSGYNHNYPISFDANKFTFNGGGLEVQKETVLDSMLQVKGKTVLDSMLQVKGKTVLNSTLQAKGVTVLDSTLQVKGVTVLGSTLQVKGKTVLDSTLQLKGVTVLDSTLQVNGVTVLDSTLQVNGVTVLGSTLQVKGKTVLDSTLQLKGETVLDSTLQVNGVTVLDSTLQVNGVTVLDSTLQVKNGATFSEDVKVWGETNLSTLKINIPTIQVDKSGAKERVYGNFIDCHDVLTPAYNNMFKVSYDGHVGAVSLGLSASPLDNGDCAKFHCGYNNTDKAWLIDTESYGEQQNIFYPIIFKAGGYTFDSGDMVVNGTLTCKNELKVLSLNADDVNFNMSNVADYVFEEDYNLKSLSEVESYIKENKHLPGIPSAAEIEQNGVSLSKMSNILLEKIEELTLHMIRLEKENAALKAEVKSLKK